MALNLHALTTGHFYYQCRIYRIILQQQHYDTEGLTTLFTNKSIHLLEYYAVYIIIIQKLRSSTTDSLFIRAIRLSTVGACIWNDLSSDITSSSPSLLTFKQRLKIHLFCLS